MPDPFEGVEPDGTIRTGARRDRVPPEFEALVVAATSAVDAAPGSLYLYGSVANGTAQPGTSDVDLLAIDVTDAPGLALSLTRDFAGLSRGVEVSVSVAQDFLGDTDEAYGNRVFLRHYCVHLAGPDRAVALPRFPADVRAARGFNGDVGRALARWRDALEFGQSPEALGVRIARKTLLAVAGLVSAHDDTWTTSRARAVERWSEIEPRLGPYLATLEAWSSGAVPSRPDVERALRDGGVVPTVVRRFADLIGLWPTEDGDGSVRH